MTDREKLIELLNVEIYPHEAKSPAEVVADYLLDNGVTVQRWIPVTERLPNICEPVLVCFDFMGGKAVRASDRYGKNGVLWSGIPSNTNVTHWMPIPEPPKEVE